MSVVLVVYGSMCRVCERVTWSYVMMKDVTNTLVQSGHDQMSINTHNRTRYWDFSVFVKSENSPWVFEIFRNSMVPRTCVHRAWWRTRWIPWYKVDTTKSIRRSIGRKKNFEMFGKYTQPYPLLRLFCWYKFRRKSHRLATRGLPVLGTIEFLKISETHGGFRVFEKTEKSQYR